MMPEFQRERYKSVTKDTFQMLVDSVMQDLKPYLKSEGEMCLGSNLAHLVVKMNALVLEYDELRKGYMDLCKANDEHKKLFFEIAKKQKSLNNHYTKKLRTIENKLP